MYLSRIAFLAGCSKKRVEPNATATLIVGEAACTDLTPGLIQADDGNHMASPV
jgi:hypothetical protein